MSDRRLRGVEIASLVLAMVFLLLVFTPWVRTGALEEIDTVNGIDIPVIGWSTIVMGLITIALAGAALATRNRWIWCVEIVSLGLMITGATMMLSTLDVMDSAVMGWITKALPDEIESASPQLQATFMLWFTYVVGLLGIVAGSLAVVFRTRFDEDAEDDLGWIEPAPWTGSDTYFPTTTWQTDSQDPPKPHWM